MSKRQSPTGGWATAIVGAAGAALLAAGCGSGSLIGVPPGADVLPASRVDTLADESHSGVEQPRREVFRTSEGWTTFWEEIHEGRSPVPEVPAVDFGSRMVIAVAMGERPSGGYAVGIEAIYRLDGALHVNVVETSPGRGCVTTSVLTRPVLAVAVPASDGEVSFHEASAVRDCA